MPWVNRRPPRALPMRDGLQHAPRPHGPLSGKRTAWRRLAARVIARVDRAMDWLPFGEWLHRLRMRGLEYSQVEIPVRRGHPDLDGLTIAFVSDVHAGLLLGEERLCEVFAAIAERRPDLVCLGGDLINTREREILYFRRPLSLLSPPLGTWAVPGNHEHFYGRDIGLWEGFLHEQGVRTLVNRGVRLQRGAGSLWLCGVDDLTEAEPDVDAARAGAGDGEPIVLLSHHPDCFFDAAIAGIDLTLSGHTHGGQIVPFGWTPLLHTEFGWWRGLYEENSSQLYVGRGVGTTLVPLRAGAPPEVPFLRLRVGGG
jgi:hypothetical protein